MPSYPLSQFSDLEEMMCKVNARGKKGAQRKLRVEQGKFGSGAKVGDAKLVDVC